MFVPATSLREFTKKKAYHPPTLQGGWKAFFGGGHIGVSAWVYHLPPFKAGLARARAPKSFLRNLPPTAHFRLSGIFGGQVAQSLSTPHNSEPIRHHGWGVWTPCAKISTDIQLFWRILVQLAKTVYLLKCCMDKNKAAKKLAKNIYIYKTTGAFKTRTAPVQKVKCACPVRVRRLLVPPVCRFQVRPFSKVCKPPKILLKQKGVCEEGG